MILLKPSEIPQRLCLWFGVICEWKSGRIKEKNSLNGSAACRSLNAASGDKSLQLPQLHLPFWPGTHIRCDWMTRQVSAGFGVRKCVISHLHKNRIQRGQYNVPQSVAICLAVCLLWRPCCIIGNVRFAYAASQQRKGSRQQDVRLTGSQDHRITGCCVNIWPALFGAQKSIYKP